MPEVAASQHVIIRKALGITGRFSENINIDFIPDEMIVRYLMYDAGETELNNSLSTVHLDLVNNIIGSFSDRFGSVHNNRFLIHKKSVKGVYEFTVQQIDGTLDTTRNGFIVIDLEFVQYK